MALLGQAVDLIDVPEKDCRCHVSPPCNDCVEHGHARDICDQIECALEADYIETDALNDLNNAYYKSINNLSHAFYEALGVVEDWHARHLKAMSEMINSDNESIELVLGDTTKKLEGETLHGFKFGLIVAMTMMGKLPFDLSLADTEADEDDQHDEQEG